MKYATFILSVLLLTNGCVVYSLNTRVERLETEASTARSCSESLGEFKSYKECYETTMSYFK